MIESISVDSDGSGAGVATSESDLYGILRGVSITYGGTPAATTDVVITEASGLGRTLLTVSNNDSDVVKHPVTQADLDTDGSGITGEYVPFYLSGKVTVTVAQADTEIEGVVEVKLLVEPIL